MGIEQQTINAMCVNKGCQLKLIQSLWRQRISGSHYDRIYRNVQVVGAGEGWCRAEFRVEPEHTNVAGLLHGGFTASLVDSISTLALLTHHRRVPGVSVNLSITYLKAAQVGDEVVVAAAADKIGRNLAFLSVTLSQKGTNNVLAKGTHTKYIGSS